MNLNKIPNVSTEEALRLCREMLMASTGEGYVDCYSSGDKKYIEGLMDSKSQMNFVGCAEPGSYSGFYDMVNRLFESNDDACDSEDSSTIYTQFETACREILEKHNIDMSEFDSKWYFGHSGMEYAHIEMKKAYVDSEIEKEMLTELDRIVEYMQRG